MLYRLRVLLADDHPLVLDGVLTVLAPKLEGAGSVSDSKTTSLNGAVEPASDRIVLDVVVVRKQLLNAIDAVVNRGVYGGPGPIGDGLAISPPVASTSRLSKRERDVLHLVAEGKATKEVAFALSISPKTVGFHRENIKNKLGLRSTAELTRYAVEQGMV